MVLSMEEGTEWCGGNEEGAPQGREVRALEEEAEAASIVSVEAFW
jgi:hypothetical protein